MLSNSIYMASRCGMLPKLKQDDDVLGIVDMVAGQYLDEIIAEFKNMTYDCESIYRWYDDGGQ